MGTSVFKASCCPGRNRAAIGHALSSNDLVNAPVSKRKAGYPNSYAAFEGASVVKDDARFAELDGEALALAFDDQVAVQSSFSVHQRGIFLSPQTAVQSSFREAIFFRLRRRFSPLSERHSSSSCSQRSSVRAPCTHRHFSQLL
jgi:hypothetical protein